MWLPSVIPPFLCFKRGYIICWPFKKKPCNSREYDSKPWRVQSLVSISNNFKILGFLVQCEAALFKVKMSTCQYECVLTGLLVQWEAALFKFSNLNFMHKNYKPKLYYHSKFSLYVTIFYLYFHDPDETLVEGTLERMNPLLPPRLSFLFTVHWITTKALPSPSQSKCDTQKNAWHISKQK